MSGVANGRRDGRIARVPGKGGRLSAEHSIIWSEARGGTNARRQGIELDWTALLMQARTLRTLTADSPEVAAVSLTNRVAACRSRLSNAPSVFTGPSLEDAGVAGGIPGLVGEAGSVRVRVGVVRELPWAAGRWAGLGAPNEMAGLRRTMNVMRGIKSELEIVGVIEAA